MQRKYKGERVYAKDMQTKESAASTLGGWVGRQQIGDW